VRKEIKRALEVEKDEEGLRRVIRLLLPGIEPKALALWFGEEQPGGRSGVDLP